MEDDLSAAVVHLVHTMSESYERSLSDIGLQNGWMPSIEHIIHMVN